MSTATATLGSERCNDLGQSLLATGNLVLDFAVVERVLERLEERFAVTAGAQVILHKVLTMGIVIVNEIEVPTKVPTTLSITYPPKYPS